MQYNATGLGQDTGNTALTNLKNMTVGMAMDQVNTIALRLTAIAKSFALATSMTPAQEKYVEDAADQLRETLFALPQAHPNVGDFPGRLASLQSNVTQAGFFLSKLIKISPTMQDKMTEIRQAMLAAIEAGNLESLSPGYAAMAQEGMSRGGVASAKPAGRGGLIAAGIAAVVAYFALKG